MPCLGRHRFVLSTPATPPPGRVMPTSLGRTASLAARPTRLFPSNGFPARRAVLGTSSQGSIAEAARVDGVTLKRYTSSHPWSRCVERWSFTILRLRLRCALFARLRRCRPAIRFAHKFPAMCTAVPRRMRRAAASLTALFHRTLRQNSCVDFASLLAAGSSLSTDIEAFPCNGIPEPDRSDLGR